MSSFTDFSSLNDLVKTWKTPEGSVGNVVTASRAATSAINVCRQLPSDYASEYAVVQVMEYNTSGSATDVTDTKGNISVPNSVISSALSKLSDLKEVQDNAISLLPTIAGEATITTDLPHFTDIGEYTFSDDTHIGTNERWFSYSVSGHSYTISASSAVLDDTSTIFTAASRAANTAPTTWTDPLWVRQATVHDWPNEGDVRVIFGSGHGANFIIVLRSNPANPYVLVGLRCFGSRQYYEATTDIGANNTFVAMANNGSATFVSFRAANSSGAEVSIAGWGTGTTTATFHTGFATTNAGNSSITVHDVPVDVDLPSLLGVMPVQTAIDAVEAL